MNFTEWLLVAAEWIGTVAFAISGAATAIERDLDLFGVLFMGLITAMGGGMIRDLLLGNVPPALFSNGEFVLASLLTALLVFVIVSHTHHSLTKRNSPLKWIVDIADALGLGIFAVLGTQVAIQAGYAANPGMCIAMGAITGCGGGALRDVMSREIPFVFTRHVYAVASIIGAAAYFLLEHGLEAGVNTAAIIAVALTTGIRVLAMMYRWNLPKARCED